MLFDSHAREARSRLTTCCSRLSSRMHPITAQQAKHEGSGAGGQHSAQAGAGRAVDGCPAWDRWPLAGSCQPFAASSLEFIATVTALRKSRLQAEDGRGSGSWGGTHAPESTHRMLAGYSCTLLHCCLLYFLLMSKKPGDHLISSWMPPGLAGSSPLNRMANAAAMMTVWDTSTICTGGSVRWECKCYCALGPGWHAPGLQQR